jgi:pyridoxal/pyridoxine/pyridoxamine kinase
LFSALVTGWSSLEQNIPLAVHKAVSSIRSVLLRTRAHKEKAGNEILLIQSRKDIEHPTLHGTLTLFDSTTTTTTTTK